MFIIILKIEASIPEFNLKIDSIKKNKKYLTISKTFAII